MRNGASRANHLRAPASVRTALFYGATLDSRSAEALAHGRLAVLAGRLSAVLARLLYATLARGRPCCAVWGSRAFVRDTSADKLSPHAIPCVFLGFVPNAPGWQFYHPTSCRVFPSQDVTFDQSVPFYRLFPYRSAPPLPSPLFLAPGPPPVDPLLPPGPDPSGPSRGAASGGAELGGAESEGAETGGAEPGGAETGGAEPGGFATGGGEPGGAEPEGVEPGGAASEGVESGDAEPQGAASSEGSAGASPSLSPQQLREWFVRNTRLRRRASGAGVAGAAGGGGTGAAAGAGVFGGCQNIGTATAGPGDAHTRGTGAAGTGGVEGAGAGDLLDSGTTGTGGPGAGGAGAGGPGVGGADTGGAGAVLSTTPSADLPPPLLCPPPDRSLRPLHPASPLPAPSPYTEQSGSLTERRGPASRPVSPVRTTHHVPHSRPPPIPCTHAMTLRPSSVPLRVPLPPPPESSLPEVPDPESDRARAASPTLLDFAAACRLDYASALVAESTSASPPSVRGECALGMDVLEDRQEDFESLAAAVPRFASLRETRMLQTSRPRALTQRRLRVLTPLSGRQPWMPRWHPRSPQAPTSTRFPHLGRT
ncbi:unnamed protein product [Closterium sp. NIES-53]